MKKLIAITLLIAMCLSLFAGCGEEEPAATQPSGNMANAKEYLTSMYQTGKKDEPIELTADQDVLKSIVIETVTYTVDWTVAITEGPADSVKVGESKKENHVMLDIPLHSNEDILFTATATITDPDNHTDTVSFTYKVVGQQLAGDGKSMEELVEAAYALDEDQALEGLSVLTGKVTMINTPYDEGYKNITVTIQIGDLSDKQIKCYRLSGDGAENIGMGDTITVSGTLKNYKGSAQFDTGCKLDELIKSTEPVPEAPADPKQIVAEAYALDKGASLPYEATLTGIITTIDSPFDPGFGNVTVTMVVEGCETQPIKCYRMKGEGADQVGPGDQITVTGYISNYNGTIEFVQGCNLDAFEKGVGEVITAPEDPKQIVAEAYALEDGALLPYQATLTGVITSVDSPYDAGYGNITVTITVEGCESQPIKCYRMKGTGVDTIKVGDNITVTGIIKNYGGTIEFDTGCQLTNVVNVPGGNDTETVVPETEPAKIMAAAEALANDQELGYTVTLSGQVTNVDNAYDATYQNITVTIAVTGTRSFLKCFRIKGDGVDQLAVGDTITATGSIKNYNGTIELVNGTMIARTPGVSETPTEAPTETPTEPNVQGETDPAKVVDAAYALGTNEELSYDSTLTGVVTTVNDAYSADYQNISVTIAVAGRESKPVLIYRMKGDGADQIAVGDTITVTGRMKNYNDTVEMVNGIMSNRISGGGSAIVQETDPAKILQQAQQLAENTEMSYDVTLSGQVTTVDDAYNADYQNITVTISVTGTSSTLKLYRMKGTGVDQLAVGDTLTVTGRIKNHYGELELVYGEMTERTSGGGTAVTVETEPAKIVDAAYALEKDAELPYDATLTGVVTMVNVPYDATYKNINVTIAVAGRESNPILCYRLKGDGVDQICQGDTITVEGRLKNYSGTIEFVNCTMTARTSGGGVVVEAPSDPKLIVDAAFALEKGASLPYKATLTGKITEIPTAYDAQYKNVTVVIEVEGSDGMKSLECYRMKGEGVENLQVGDTITVSGVIKHYYKEATDEKPELSKIEFDAGCTLG